MPTAPKGEDGLSYPSCSVLLINTKWQLDGRIPCPPPDCDIPQSTPPLAISEEIPVTAERSLFQPSSPSSASSCECRIVGQPAVSWGGGSWSCKGALRWLMLLQLLCCAQCCDFRARRECRNGKTS